MSQVSHSRIKLHSPVPRSVLEVSDLSRARHLPASVVGYGMFGSFSNRDLPALAVILACAVVERVMESRWCRLAVMAVSTALATWLVVGG